MPRVPRGACRRALRALRVSPAVRTANHMKMTCANGRPGGGSLDARTPGQDVVSVRGQAEDAGGADEGGDVCARLRFCAPARSRAKASPPVGSDAPRGSGAAAAAQADKALATNAARTHALTDRPVTQEYKRNIDRSVREIEREKTKLQQQVAMLACVHALGHTPLVGTRTMHTRMRAHL